MTEETENNVVPEEPGEASFSKVAELLARCTVFLVRVASSVSKLRKLCTGPPSASR